MRRSILALSAFAFAPSALAQTAPAAPPQQVAPDPAFDARAKELVAILAGTGDYDSFFSPAFRTAVPKDKFAALNTQLAAAYGAPVALSGMTLASPYQGTVTVRYTKGELQLAMAVNPAAPHQVIGLRVQPPAAPERTLSDVAAAIEKLHGATGFAFAKLGAGKPIVSAHYNADQRFAVGSAFKLPILAELIREINTGMRKWDDPVTLDGRQLPGGLYLDKPAGTQVSLRELATEMISKSDNSATDILLATLGREKVEVILPLLGVAPDPRNRPYLATLEAFKLKWLDDGKIGDRYAAASEATQRAMLAGEVRGLDLAPLANLGERLLRPSHIADLEWFFSANDLIRIMDWIRRNTEGPKGADARAILSKNPGLAYDKAQYAWVGFKGGSEPGVMNLTLLLQGVDGNWYAAAASWNDANALVESERFAGLMTALVKYAGPAKP